MESILLQHLVFFPCLLYFLLMMHFIFLSMINWLLMYLILSTMWPFLGPLQFESLSLYLPYINTTQQLTSIGIIQQSHLPMGVNYAVPPEWMAMRNCEFSLYFHFGKYIFQYIFMEERELCGEESNRGKLMLNYFVFISHQIHPM